MISCNEIKVDPERMKVEIEITTVPKIVLISGGRVKEVELPHHGEVIVKTAQGKIAKYETKEGELF